MKIAGLPVPQIDATCEAAECVPQPAAAAAAAPGALVGRAAAWRCSLVGSAVRVLLAL